MSHRTDCPDWVKVALMIAGGWALQNSALKWASDHIRHHAHCDGDMDPYNAQRGFGIAAMTTLAAQTNEKYLGGGYVMMLQHRYYFSLS